MKCLPTLPCGCDKSSSPPLFCFPNRIPIQTGTEVQTAPPPPPSPLHSLLKGKEKREGWGGGKREKLHLNSKGVSGRFPSPQVRNVFVKIQPFCLREEEVEEEREKGGGAAARGLNLHRWPSLGLLFSAIFFLWSIQGKEVA